ncbi:MAG: class I SAM-dependent methyltransferase [Bacteroidia bacterium]|nr:class I SAM-dependent methyltransferase [Bacteroidia bacterium]
MKLINTTLNYAIGKAKRSKLMQSLFEAPIDIAALPEMGRFTDSFGNDHVLYSGFRNRIKPGWERMLNRSDTFIGEPDYDKVAVEGKSNFSRIQAIAKAYGISITEANILEIGCHLGAVCYSFAENGCQATGSEFTGYKVSALDSEGSARKLEQVSSALTKQRITLGQKFRNTGNVTFTEDDICNSSLPTGQFDLVISFDVLEHLHDPGAAFVHIQRILKKGGIAIHEYNPFFSLNGGHSLCTLDFPWGHCRLNKPDFERYIREIRPLEIGPAISFFNEGLNRMTQLQMENLTVKAGLEAAGIIRYSKEQHVRMVTKEILEQSSSIYQGLTIADLVSPKVMVIQRKY